MVNGIRASDLCRLDKGRGSNFSVGSQETPEEGQRTYQPKRCGYDNKDEDNSPKTLNDKNHLFLFSLEWCKSKKTYQEPCLIPAINSTLHTNSYDIL